MTHSHVINDAQHMRQFMLAGNATFTLVSQRSGARFTYRMRKSEDGKVYFVSRMTGPDNEHSYTYFGIVKDGRFLYGRKAKLPETDLGVRAFMWAFDHIYAGKPLPEAEFWHEGRCGRCGRLLTVPESIDRGIGPECDKQMRPFWFDQVA